MSDNASRTMDDTPAMPYKIVDSSGRRRIGVVVCSLRELMVTAQSKFGITSPVKVVEIHDGTLVDSESYFRTRVPNSCFQILKEAEDYVAVSLSEHSSSSRMGSPSVSSHGFEEPVASAVSTSREENKKPARRGQKRRQDSSKIDVAAKVGKLDVKKHSQVTKNDSKDQDFCSASESNVSNGVQILGPVLFSSLSEYLTLEDRKNVRLTCKAWNDICNEDFNTCSKEKLVFWPTNGLDSVTQCIEQSKRCVLNLEFQTDELYLMPEEIWKKYGHKFLSVVWNTSSVGDGDYKTKDARAVDVWWKVLYYCPKLNYVKQTSDYNDDDVILSHKLLERLRLTQEKFVHACMKKAKCTSYNEKTWSEISQVFPNIDNFSVEFDFGGVSLPNFQVLPKTVERLCLNGALGSLGSECFMKHCLKNPNKCFKLKNLKLSIAYRRDLEEYLFPFFNLQTKLEVVNLQFSDTFVETGCSPKALKKVDSFKAKLIERIVNSSPNLRVLKINFDTEELKTTSTTVPVKNDSVAKKFTNKLLQLSSVYIVGFDISKQISRSVASTARSNLRTLRLPENPSGCTQLLKFHALLENLQCLVIPKCKLKMLETICASQVNLKTLRVLELSEGAVKSPKAKTIEKCLEKFKNVPIVSFSKLEHLDVWGTYSMLQIFGQFHFPVLKHLHISVAEISDDLTEVSYHMSDAVRENFLTILERLPARAPNLEILKLEVPTNGVIKNTSDVNFIEQLSKLEIFAFGTHEMAFLDMKSFGHANFVKEASLSDFEQMFKLRPTLRFILNATNLYFYDRQSGTVIRRKIKDQEYKTNFNYAFKKDSCCKLLPTRAWEN